ncbi:MAG: hypothetical protein WC349_04170 [Patescibacteria group bacterium]|jgi:hypothetical protein
MNYNQKVLIVIEYILSQQYNTPDTERLMISVKNLCEAGLSEIEVNNILTNLVYANYIERASNIDDLIEAGICKSKEENMSRKEELEISEYNYNIMKKLPNIKPNYEKLLDYKIKLMQVTDGKINKSQISKPKEPLIKLPPNTDWEDMTIELVNDYDVEIYVKGKFFCKSNNEKMNFFKKNSKNKKSNEAWNFFKELSANNGKLIRKPIVSEKAAQDDEKYRKRKEKLSILLKECFGKNDDPFDKDAGVGIYKVRFTLKPIPILRGNGELRGIEDISNEYLPSI